MALRYLTTEQNFGASGKLKYPNPFFDLSKNYIPKDIKTLFRICRTYFYKNELLHQIIKKLSEYPITDILYNDVEDSNVREKYDILLKHRFQIKGFLRDIGLDFYTFGNSFIITNLDFIRWLTCPKCNDSFQALEAKVGQVKFQKFKYHGMCPKCGATVEEFKVDDKTLVGPEHLKFLRLSPESVDIEYTSITGKCDYFLNIDSKVKKIVNIGDRPKVDGLPWIFIEAVKENRKIKLEKNNLYHFKASTLAEDDMGWGKPPLLPCLGIIWYNQTLRRANEAIAAEHILPKRYLSPASSTSGDPMSVNLGRWRASMEDQLQRWRKDENHVGIFPIAVNAQSIGGDGKILMLHNELRINEETIINAMGVPIEFIKGGASWTGSSVSLRIVENRFMNYREDLLDFLNYFVLDKISQFLDYPRIKVKFRSLRMSDDSETKDLALRTAQQGWLSPTHLLDQLGFEPETDQKYRISDTKFDNELAAMRAEAQADAQATAQETLAKAQIRSQQIMQELAASYDEKLFGEELAVEMKVNKEETGIVLRKLAVQFSLLPPEGQNMFLNELSQTMPLTAGFVIKRLQIASQFSMGEEKETPEEQTKETTTVTKKSPTKETKTVKEHTRKGSIEETQ